MSANSSIESTALSEAVNLARHACVDKCLQQTEQSHQRLGFALASIRQSSRPSEESPAMPALVSTVLDDFTGNARSAAEICTARTGSHDDRKRIEQSLSMLGAMFEKHQKDIKAGDLSPAEFMPGAEFISETVQRDLAKLHQEFERVCPVPAAKDGERSAARERIH